MVCAPLSCAERCTQTDLHHGQLAPSTILRSGPWFCYTWFDIDLLIWIRIVYGWEFTSWLNSQAVFGAEWITTSLVPGTSSPMLPAEVDKRALTDLNIGKSLPSKNTTNPSLLLGPTFLSSELLMQKSGDPRIIKIPMLVQSISIYHDCLPLQRLQIEIFCSRLEEWTLNDQRSVLYKVLFQVYTLALLRRNLLWKNIWMLSCCCKAAAQLDTLENFYDNIHNLSFLKIVVEHLTFLK